MKGIQPDCRRLLVLAAAALILGCGLEGERDIVRADAEIFEAVVRSQLSDSSAVADGSAMRGLRIDSRPAGDNTELAATPEQTRPLELGGGADSLSADAHGAIVEQRKDILKSLSIEEGGPFNYPDCGGARTRRSTDSTLVLEAPKCPRALQRYITVGLPFRGAAEILTRARPAEVPAPAPDSTSESWTVLVTESSVGPGGQQWRKYVNHFRRDQATGRLGLAERYLLSWAE